MVTLVAIQFFHALIHILRQDEVDEGFLLGVEGVVDGGFGMRSAQVSGDGFFGAGDIR